VIGGRRREEHKVEDSGESQGRTTPSQLETSLSRSVDGFTGEEVDLAHLVREVNVQSSHQCSNLYGHRLRFLLLKKIAIGLPLSYSIL
jgi:hypothetical protein